MTEIVEIHAPLPTVVDVVGESSVEVLDVLVEGEAPVLEILDR